MSKNFIGPFLFWYTHVIVDTYKNEVQHNADHTDLYRDVRTVDLHLNNDGAPLTNRYEKISTVVFAT
jgi:hypothetical protein